MPTDATILHSITAKIVQQLNAEPNLEGSLVAQVGLRTLRALEAGLPVSRRKPPYYIHGVMLQVHDVPYGEVRVVIATDAQAPMNQLAMGL